MARPLASADVYPMTHPDRADLVDGSIGERSPFHDTFGYNAQGGGEETAVLPEGWKARLIPCVAPAHALVPVLKGFAGVGARHSLGAAGVPATLPFVKGHRSAERRSLALHGAIAERLREDLVPLELARARVAAWRAGGTVHREYVDAWADLLAGPLADVCALLVDPGERGCALRQVSPFAGALSARERWRIIKSVA